MKHLKSFKLFESNWSPEEFMEEIRNALSKYNLSSVEVREIINRVDIDGAIERGEQPIMFIKNLIDELQLGNLGSNGFNSFRVSRPLQTEIKYL